MNGWNKKQARQVGGMARRKSGEGSYDKIGDTYVWWRRVGNRRFVVKRKDYTEFRKEVQRKLAEIEQLATSTPPPDATLDQFLPAWIEGFVAPPKRARGTYRSYLGAYKNQIQPHLGAKKLSKLKTAMIQGWINELGVIGTGARTVQIAFIVLKRALVSAVTQGYLSRNPCDGCELPRTPQKQMRVLSPQEMCKLLAEAFHRPHVHRRDAIIQRQGCRYRHLYRFLLLSGLRISEALGLKIDRIELKNGLVHVVEQLEWDSKDGWSFVPPKTKSSIRTIVLEDAAVRTLRHQLALIARDKELIEDYQEYGLVFPTLRGTPSHPRNIQRQLDVLLERAELKHCCLHDLRRTCLTNLANRGLPLHQLKAYAGHTSITTTSQYYVHVSLEAMRHSMMSLKPLENTVPKLSSEFNSELLLLK